MSEDQAKTLIEQNEKIIELLNKILTISLRKTSDDCLNVHVA